MPLGTPDPKSINNNLTPKPQSGQTSQEAQAKGNELLMKLFKGTLPIVQDPQPMQNPSLKVGKSQQSQQGLAQSKANSLQVEKPLNSQDQTENPMEHISRMSEAQLEMLKGLDF
jgi:hypothetical protein